MTDQAKEFLWFVQFGKTYTECAQDHNLALKTCAQSAYIDLCRTLDYKISSSELEKNPKKYEDYIKNKNNFIEKINSLICRCIQDNLSKPDFADKLSCLRDSITTKAKKENTLFNESGFYYGQAQKWVNMTIKYMDVMGFWQTELDKHRNKLHIPIDNYIIQYVWENINFKNGEKNEKTIPLPYIAKNGPHNYKYNEDKVVRWSKWDEKQYNAFQEELKDYLEKSVPAKTPLDWEAHAWIEIAKKKTK